MITKYYPFKDLYFISNERGYKEKFVSYSTRLLDLITRKSLQNDLICFKKPSGFYKQFSDE